MLKHRRKFLQQREEKIKNVSEIISGMGMMKISDDSNSREVQKATNVEELKNELKKLDISNNKVKKNKRYIKF